MNQWRRSLTKIDYVLYIDTDTDMDSHTQATRSGVDNRGHWVGISTILILFSFFAVM